MADPHSLPFRSPVTFLLLFYAICSHLSREVLCMRAAHVYVPHQQSNCNNQTHLLHFVTFHGHSVIEQRRTIRPECDRRQPPIYRNKTDFPDIAPNQQITS
jgi:hypothetical protein